MFISQEANCLLGCFSIQNFWVMNDQSLFFSRMIVAINKRNLTQPVLFLFEVIRPFTFIFAQLVWVAQPALGLIIPRQKIGRFATLLEKPDVLDDLVQQLEQLADE